MIVTVTLNLALDVTYSVERLVKGGVNTVRAVHGQAGGKGVNVARTLQQMGIAATATGFCGGSTGREIELELTEAGIPHRLVHVPGENRRCTAVVESEDGVTEINEPGPEIGRESWEEFIAVFERLIEELEPEAVACSGSLPPGLQEDAYATLCAVARAGGAYCLVDAGGTALRRSLAAHPDLAKPNRSELVSATGATPSPGPDASDWAGLADVLREEGAGSVVVSLGEEGLLAVTEEGNWHARPPLVQGNPVGAGDAAAAALLRGHLQGAPWPKKLLDSAALSAAAVAAPVAGRFDPDVYEEARGTTVVRKLE